MANKTGITFGIRLYYWIATDLPFLFKPFAVVDALMFVLFVIAYRQLAHERP